MNAIPSIESILLQVHQSLELPAYTSKQKASFSQVKRSLKKHSEQFEEILDGIFRSLEIHKDKSASSDLREDIFKFAAFQKELELNTWTFDAEAKQVIWHMLSHSYIPGIARKVAFWNLEDKTDKGMPGGSFWYLPEKLNGELIMPVSQVCNWLLDLIGIPLEQFRTVGLVNRSSETIIRNIYNWKNGKVPRLETIKSSFPDSLNITFKGCLHIDESLPVEEQLNQVTEFIKFKKLSSADLVHEIPIREQANIDDIIAGNASSVDTQNFIHLMLIRYTQPSFKTIRQRLHIAKAVQDGYKRLLKFLCPKVSPTCVELNDNKVLQLFTIYKRVYNLTVEAYERNNNRSEEDKWFENQFPKVDSDGLFLSITPSNFSVSSSLLGERLTKRFRRMKANEPLTDFFDDNPGTSTMLLQQRTEQHDRWAKKATAGDELQNNIWKGSPWRALQKEDRYWVLFDVIGGLTNNHKAFNAGLNRLNEVANSPVEGAGVIQLELNYLVELPKGKRSKGHQDRVYNLIEKIEQHEGYTAWKALALLAKAKHYIALNEFKAASGFFKRALNACSESSYGPLKGLIARDTLATLLQVEKLNENNHECYLREMLNNDAFETVSPIKKVNLEDISRMLNTHFRDKLDKPYQNIE